MRQAYVFHPFVVETYVNELHRLQITVDHDGEVDEINEADNTWISEYVLVYPPGYNECGPYDETMNLVWDLSNRCQLSLRIPSGIELNDRRRLERFEEVVAGISSPRRSFVIDLQPPHEELARDFDRLAPSDQERGQQAYIRERRVRYRNQLAQNWGADWEHIKSQVESVLQRRADCLGQS